MELVLVCVLTVMYSGKVNGAIDTTDISVTLGTMLDAIGVDDMQSVLDNDVTVSTYPMDSDGAMVTQSLKTDLENQMNEQMQLVRHLQTSVQDSYNGYLYYATHHQQQCCDMYHDSREIDYSFKAYVNKEVLCYRRSQYANPSPRYPTPTLLERFKENMRLVPGVKYQYFGSRDGVLFSYPATTTQDCSDYDPRFRPWYVETATPVAKDIVLVLDISSSMSDYYNFRKKIDMAIEAALTVIDTLNPNDRVGVITFSTNGSPFDSAGHTCFQNHLAVANAKNRRRFMEYIREITPSGQSYYSRGLDKAFQLFINTPDDGVTRKKAILFLTDGSASESDSIIISKIIEKESLLNREVTIMPFAIGNIGSAAENTLQSMCATYQTHQTEPQIITDSSELKRAMGFYYTFFGNNQISTPILASPYYDAFGLGLITTLSLPVYANGEFMGVVGVDVSLSEMFQLTNVRPSHKTYPFAATPSGMALSHPMLPLSYSVTDDPIEVPLKILEKNEVVTNSMMNGHTNSDTGVTSTVSVARGTGRLDGMVQHTYTADYYWDQIRDNSTNAIMASIGVKLEVGGTFSMMTSSIEPFFTYHNYHLHDGQFNECRHFLSRAIADDSVVKFAPQSFITPYRYLDTRETTDTVVNYNDDIHGFSDPSEMLLTSEAIESAKFTSKIHERWFDWSRGGGNTTVWRYIGMDSGMIRITPGTKLPKLYDPTERGWYQKAVSFPGRAVWSAPYLDAFGAGYVITLSKALFRGVPGASSHSDNEPVVGVMSADYSINSVHSIFQSDFSDCNTDSDRCFVIDTAGYLVLHPDFVTISGDENPLRGSLHITIKEEDIAEYLLASGHMVKRSCHNPHNVTESVYYEIDPDVVTRVSSSSPEFEMVLIPETNVFIVVRSTAEVTAYCPCHNTEILAECDTSSCVCPCENHWPDVYTPCTNTYSYSSLSDFSVCTPDSPQLEIELSVDNEDLPVCFHVDCWAKENKDVCYSFPQCNWCIDEGDEFCADADYCYFGQVGYDSPYSIYLFGDVDVDKFDWTVLRMVLNSLHGLPVVIWLAVVLPCFIYHRKEAKRKMLEARAAMQQMQQQVGAGFVQVDNQLQPGPYANPPANYQQTAYSPANYQPTTAYNANYQSTTAYNHLEQTPTYNQANYQQAPTAYTTTAYHPNSVTNY